MEGFIFLFMSFQVSFCLSKVFNIVQHNFCMVSNKDSFSDAAKIALELEAEKKKESALSGFTSSKSTVVETKKNISKKKSSKKPVKKFAYKKPVKSKKTYSKKMLDDVTAQPMLVEKTTTVTTTSTSSQETKKEPEIALSDDFDKKPLAPFGGGLIEMLGGGLIILIGFEILLILILFLLWIF